VNLAGALVALVLTVTTQNVRLTLPPDQAHHDINQAAQGSSVLFTQEMGARDAATFAPDGWGHAHVMGGAVGDCATFWDQAVWRSSGHRLVRLTHASFRAGSRYALVTILHKRGDPTVTLAAVCAHMITKSLARRRVYSRGMRRLHTLLVHLERFSYVVVGGDWNRDWHQRVRLSGFQSAMPPATTHDTRRIDFFYWYSKFTSGAGIRVLHHTFSDHNGVRMNLRLHTTSMRQ
jgi:hypothetical protein